MENVKVGIVGLGRLGKIHALNLSKQISGCILVAACSLIKEELDFAVNNLGVTETYKTYEEMIGSSNLNAVCIVSPSGFHCKQIRQAMDKNLHVFSEKPIGLDIKDIEETQRVIEAHPNQVFMLGFMRRYDESYKYAKQMVDDGELGEITIVRSYGIDPSEGMESFVKFAGNSNSGGLFADMSIHDIDLVRWFTKKRFPRFGQWGKMQLILNLMR